MKRVAEKQFKEQAGTVAVKKSLEAGSGVRPALAQRETLHVAVTDVAPETPRQS